MLIVKRFDQDQKGQTLIIIFLVMLLALSVGIAISSRFINTTSVITQSDDGSRALAVAESAIEHVLLLPISTLEEYVNNGTCGTDCYLAITGADGQTVTANIELSKLGDSFEPYVVDMELEETTQIVTSGYPANVPLYVCWNNDMSISALNIKGTLGNYEADAYSYNSATSSHSENYFEAAAPALGYQSCFTVVADDSPALLRLKPFYEDGTAVIVPADGNNLPNQGILIKSTGEAGTATKIVTVIITDPVLPNQFDYVLYQKSDTEPLSN